jgi:hypothetical protein
MSRTGHLLFIMATFYQHPLSILIVTTHSRVHSVTDLQYTVVYTHVVCWQQLKL